MISTCFVIMGFNIKTNEDGKEYNLDLSYSEMQILLERYAHSEIGGTFILI